MGTIPSSGDSLGYGGSLAAADFYGSTFNSGGGSYSISPYQGSAYYGTWTGSAFYTQWTGKTYAPYAPFGWNFNPSAASDNYVLNAWAGITSGSILLDIQNNSASVIQTMGDGTLKLMGSSSGYVGLKSTSSPTSYTMTLPSTVASLSGQVLTSDTSGNLSWTTISSYVAPISNILNWNGTAYAPYSTQQAGGDFDSSSTMPAHTNRLNYDGNLYANAITANTVSTLNTMTFNTSPTLGSFQAGTLYYDNTHMTFSAQIDNGITLNLGEMTMIYSYNGTGSSIPIGSVVYVNGVHGIFPTVALAQANATVTANAIGMTAEAIANGSTGCVVVRGTVSGLNTSGLTPGATLYLSPTVAGGITNTQPMDPTQFIVNLGYAIVQDPSVGTIYIQSILHTRLSDLLDVSIASPSVGQMLTYNGAQWVNGPAATASAGPGVEFFSSTPNLIPAGTNNALPVNSLSKTPTTTAEQTASGTANSNTVAAVAWLYNAALNRTQIDGGNWDFELWAAVSSANGNKVTTISRYVYTVMPYTSITVTTSGTGTSRTATASSGTPFSVANVTPSATNTTASYLQTPQGLYQITGYTADNIVTILVPSTYANESSVAFSTWYNLFGITTAPITQTGTNYELMSTSTTQTSFATSTSAQLGMIGFVTSNSTVTATVTYNGTARNSYVASPLQTLHNDLPGLQGGVSGQYYHLTSAQYTVVGNTSGTNTGDQNLSNLVTGAASSTDGDIALFSGTTGKIIKDGGYTSNNLLPSGSANQTLRSNGTSWVASSLMTNNGTNIAVSGALQLNGSSSGYVGIQTTSSPTSYTVTLPSAVATLAGQALTSDTSGNLSWTTITSYVAPASNILNWNGTAYAPYATQQAGGYFDTSATTPAHTTRLNYDGNLYANVLNSNGLELLGSSSGYVKMQTTSGPSSYTITLPSAVATVSGQALTSDTSGNLSWTTQFSLPALTSGSVLFSNGTTIAQDNSQLFWDDTDHWLGIGTNVPTSDISFGYLSSRNISILAQTNNNNPGASLSITAGNSITTVPTTFMALGQPYYNWEILFTYNGDMYAKARSLGFYKQTAGAGNFNLYYSSALLFTGACALGSDIYAHVYNGGIYKQTGGSGSFNIVSNTLTALWYGMCALGGNLYMVTNDGKVYSVAGGTGTPTLIATQGTSTSWIATDGTNTYFGNSTGVYSMAGGTGTPALISGPGWTNGGCWANGNFYVADRNTGHVLMQTGGVGAFNTISTSFSCNNLCAFGASVYGDAYGGDIYVQQNGNGTADLAGGFVNISSGQGKGAGASVITFLTATPLASGTTLQSAPTEKMRVNGTGQLLIGTTSASGTGLLQVKGSVDILGSSSGYVGIQTTSGPSSYTLTLPSAVASVSGQALTSDTSGNLSWTTQYVLPAFTAGSILFSNGTTIAQDNSQLFWDDTNHRIGIGTNAPSNDVSFGYFVASRKIWAEQQMNNNNPGVNLSIAAGDSVTTVPATFNPLGQTYSSWYGMASANGNVYAAVNAVDIWMQTGGSGNFAPLGQTHRGWLGMGSLGSNVYCCVPGGDIYMQTGGTGNFVALGQTSRSWQYMTSANGNMYCCVYGGDIYMQTGGTGNFVALGQTSRNWEGMATLGTNVYACVYGGDIYVQTGGTGNFVALGQASRNWNSMASANGNVYAAVFQGDIYMQTSGTGTFTALGAGNRFWGGMASLGSNVYASVTYSDIYEQINGNGISDLSGGTMAISSGRGKGAGASNITFSTATTLTTGTILQTISEKARITGAGQLLIGSTSASGTAMVQVSGSAQLAAGGTPIYVPLSTGTVTAGTGITSAMLSGDMRYNGGSAVTITANPQIAAGTDGQVIKIIGLSDTNTLTISTGNGLKLQAGIPFTIGAGDVIELTYVAALSVWVENYRSDNT